MVVMVVRKATLFPQDLDFFHIIKETAVGKFSENIQVVYKGITIYLRIRGFSSNCDNYVYTDTWLKRANV